jgi:polyphosphate kinase
VYLSSADWMPRNLDRRVELMFPVRAPAPKARLIRILETFFRDNVKARRLTPDGTYRRVKPSKDRLRCQDYFMALADRRVRRAEAASLREFRPRRPAR